MAIIKCGAGPDGANVYYCSSAPAGMSGKVCMVTLNGDVKVKSIKAKYDIPTAGRLEIAGYTGQLGDLKTKIALHPAVEAGMGTYVVQTSEILRWVSLSAIVRKTVIPLEGQVRTAEWSPGDIVRDMMYV